MNQQVLEAKQNVVKEIAEKMKNSGSVTIAEFRGLTVSQIQQLRRDLHEVNAELSVYKNSLVTRAVDQLKYKGLDDLLVGPNALIFSKDLSDGPKVVKKYSRRFGDVLTIKGGIAEGKTLDKASVIEIAALPDKDGMISMFLSCLQAPIRQFACVVQAVADAK
ncbi:MAG: 50S ribosomal protein L10 [Bacilli bacterium]